MEQKGKICPVTEAFCRLCSNDCHIKNMTTYVGEQPAGTNTAELIQNIVSNMTMDGYPPAQIQAFINRTFRPNIFTLFTTTGDGES